MKNFLFAILVFTISSFTLTGVNPWTAEQLYDPAALVKVIKDPKAPKPLILNTGTMRNIKGAVKLGPVSDYDGLKQFKAGVVKFAGDKNKEVVIYCGCCKMDHCPNVEPAYTHLQSLGFKKVKILNLQEDLIFDWVNKGYPMDAKQPF
ncbi:MAG: rhodanese-like domain-containing protein [Opitutaceae bacterium]|nr:rhodanese-like domain-containing protein [Cytophagales bacterium]